MIELFCATWRGLVCNSGQLLSVTPYNNQNLTQAAKLKTGVTAELKPVVTAELKTEL